MEQEQEVEKPKAKRKLKPPRTGKLRFLSDVGFVIVGKGGESMNPIQLGDTLTIGGFSGKVVERECGTCLAITSKLVRRRGTIEGGFCYTVSRKSVHPPFNQEMAALLGRPVRKAK